MLNGIMEWGTQPVPQRGTAPLARRREAFHNGEHEAPARTQATDDDAYWQNTFTDKICDDAGDRE